MPTPVGHTIIGAAIGLGYALPRGCAWRDMPAAAVRNWRMLLAAVVASNLPDLDYLPGIFQGAINAYHHLFTHSIGWALLVATGGWLCARGLKPELAPRMFVLLLVCLVAHLAADWLTDDGSPPYGIMAGWPWSDRYTISPVVIFPRVLKSTWSEVFQPYNLIVGGVEVLITLPVLLMILAMKCFASGGDSAPQHGEA